MSKHYILYNPITGFISQSGVVPDYALEAQAHNGFEVMETDIEYDGINYEVINKEIVKKIVPEPEPVLVSIEELRMNRNTLLNNSDFRDLPSYPGSDQEAWREYRQALRDLPDGYVPVEEPVFPIPPNN